MVGDAQGLVEVLGGGYHLLKHLPRLVVVRRSVDELLDLRRERGKGGHGTPHVGAGPRLQPQIAGGNAAASAALTFSNWWTRKMPRVSRPCEPTSCRKQVDNPAYLMGRSSGFSHSSRCSAAMGCSEVAIRYFSSMELSSAFSLPLPMT